MNLLSCWLFMCCLIIKICENNAADQFIFSTDELENHISPEDLQEFLKLNEATTTTLPAAPNQDYADIDLRLQEEDSSDVPKIVDCFGLGSFFKQLLTFFNMRPDTADKINTQFYFSSRRSPRRLQVLPGPQFGLEWVDFKPERRTIIIIHGFMSHSNASWVIDLTKAFLSWADVNVITVDWSGGGNTWKYWRAVANTRRVGSDVTNFLRQLIERTGARVKDFHLVGHSLGAHISSYASYHIGKVSRITGLDPAQPCFTTTNSIERLDASDADFVDVIHTNGRLLSKFGLGLPEPTGDADFFPNGGMIQPGCYNATKSFWNRYLPTSFTQLQQAICSHGRAYLLFTESLINDNCTFQAHQWNLTFESVNASLEAACDHAASSCAEMGINAAHSGAPRARGPYFVITSDHTPYCSMESEQRHLQPELLRDLQKGFRLDRSQRRNTTNETSAVIYADPDVILKTTTTKKPGWLARIFG